MKADPTFETEAQLCEAFIAWAKQKGYVAYPETADFDILLVDAQGFQIGVEAKLRLNLKVVMQALPGGYGQETGPDHRAVLVPSLEGDLRYICKHLGLEIFYCTTRYGHFTSRPVVRHDFHWDDEHSGRPMFDWNPTRRCKLPEYMPDVAAGVPAPLKLTEWKTGALKVLAHLAIHGTITRKQIKAYGNDSRAWCGPNGWLLPHSGDKRDGRWMRGQSCPPFDKQHPTVFQQVKADLIAAGEPAGQVELGVI